MKTKQIFTLLAFAAILLISSCKEEIIDVKFTDVGPDMTIVSYDNAAIMGGHVDFSVSLASADKDYSLSTLTVALLFDDVAVDEMTIRTKTDGIYAGTLDVPFYANIPDGNARLAFSAINTGLGVTETTVDVAVSRPVFDYLTLKSSDGNEYTMTWTEGHLYEVTQEFPATVNATIETATFGDNDTTLVFSWGSSTIQLGEGSSIPFSNGVAGTYTISFNTLTFEGSPFVSLEVNGNVADMIDADNYMAVVSLTQGGTVEITGYAAGFEGWIIDPDFIEETGTDGVYAFLPVDGLYKVNINTASKFFKFERMSSATETATLNSDGTGAVWLIGGACFGKPMIWSYSWNTDDGALCLAEISDKIHQITLEAGSQLSTSDIDIKFFHQKGWGGEFGSVADGGYLVTDSDLITVGEDDGNIHLADGISLDMGGVYRLTVDLTGASYSGSQMSGGVLHFEKIGQNEVESQDISINGVTLSMVSTSLYEGNVNFTKDGEISYSGISASELAGYFIDPDYLYMDGSTPKFNAATGLYHFTMNVTDKYFVFKRMSDESTYAKSTEGAIWLLGWGGAHPTMVNQFGWDTANGYCLAEVNDNIFQLTGIAVEEDDATTMGGRFRYDYFDIKYYGEYNSWNNECGQIFGETTTVRLADGADALIKLNGTNIDLADGVSLELGSTYVLRVDLSKAESDKEETIDFYKQE